MQHKKIKHIKSDSAGMYIIVTIKLEKHGISIISLIEFAKSFLIDTKIFNADFSIVD